MKTLIKIVKLLSFLWLLSSCRENQGIMLEEGGHDGVVFSAINEDNELSKTVVSESSTYSSRILWRPKEEISVYFYESDIYSAKFVSDNTEVTSKANFVGSFAGFPDTSSGFFWALYPYREDNAFDGEAVYLNVSSSQRAIPGSFDTNAYPSLARSRGFLLSFHNICGGVRFSVQHEGIRKVVFKSNGGESLAGRIKVGLSEDNIPSIVNVTEVKNEIELLMPEGETFQKNKWYYIVTLPTVLTKGYTLEFYREQKIGERKNESAIPIMRNVFGQLSDADNVVVDVSEPRAIDMGVSVKWASHNVGALSMTEMGARYAWGEISPKNTYTLTNYKWSDEAGKVYTKYGDGSQGVQDGKFVLESEDDVATAIYGEQWRMPTIDEINELIESTNCSWTLSVINGVDGYIVKSMVTNNEIFLPKAHSIGEVNYPSLYWSSSLAERADLSFSLGLDNLSSGSYYRSAGLYVRPVMDYTIRIEGKDEILISPEDQMIEVGVISTDGAKFLTCPEWMSYVDGTKQSDYTTKFSFKVTSNQKSSKRKGVVQFANNHGDITELSVIQEQVEARLVVSGNSYYFNCMGGERELSIDTNRDWTISVSEPWLSLSSTSGSYSSKLKLSALANNSMSERNAVITVKSSDESLDDVIINVRQDATPTEEIDWNASFYRKSIALLFISTQEGESFRIIDGGEECKTLLPDHIELVNIQKSGSILALKGVDVLSDRFSVDSPSAVVDGRILVDCKYGDSGYPQVGSLVYSAVLNTESNYSNVYSSIAYQSSLTERTFSINEQIYCKEASNYKVTTLLVEDNVVAPQEHTRMGTIRDFCHNNVARCFLSDIQGDEVNTSSNNEVVNLHYTYEIPNEFNIENLRVVIFVERVFGNLPVVTTGSYGDYYVDNCTSGKIGSSQSPALIKDGNGGTEDFENGEDINW